MTCSYGYKIDLSTASGCGERVAHATEQVAMVSGSFVLAVVVLVGCLVLAIQQDII